MKPKTYSLLVTHFYFSYLIAGDEYSDIRSQLGLGGMADWSIFLATEFEKEFKHYDWNCDYYERIEEYIDKHINTYTHFI